MNRRALIAGSAGLLLTVLSGCGISSRSDVVTVEAGPTAGAGNVQLGKRPGDWSSLPDKQAMVKTFLLAAAGDHATPEGLGLVRKRLNTFFAPQLAKDWRPTTQAGSVKIVRFIEDELILGTQSDVGDVVNVKVQQVGLLDSLGRLEPAKRSEPVTYSFKVIQADGGFKIADAPAELLLLESGLSQFYEEMFVYFWSVDRERMIPDLRYLALVTPEDLRPTRWVDYLQKGPSSWLASGVDRVSQRINRNNFVTKDKGDYVVDVSVKASSEELGLLFKQLSRTLTEKHGGGVKLKVDGQLLKDLGTATWELPDKTMTRYAIVNDAVTEIPSGAPPLTSEQNRKIEVAAIAREKAAVALVKQLDNGKQQLLIGRMGLEGPGNIIPVPGFVKNEIAQPVWLERKAAATLVLADGKVFRVMTTGETQQVAFADNAPIKAISVAWDGRRLAYVANDRLYVAALKRENGVMSVGESQELPVSQRDLQGVAFSGAGSVVVAGTSIKDGVVTLGYYGIDGVQRENSGPRWAADTAITGLVAFPDDVSANNITSNVMFMKNGVAIEGPFSASVPLQVKLPTPSPSASGAPKSVKVTAPSFEG